MFTKSYETEKQIFHNKSLYNVVFFVTINISNMKKGAA